ncbi:MAG: VOC family protein [Phycisphaerales bacterium]|nr:VOC family protein [Phycisphaerales bacterium]
MTYHVTVDAPSAIHETVLYAEDVAAASRFYGEVIGLRVLPGSDDTSAAFRLPRGDAMLLVFNAGYAERPGRGVPVHGARGAGHVAFRVEPGSLDGWRSHLEARGVPIELDRPWPRGGRSVYVRDPAGNSVELVDGEIWAR